MGSPGDLLVVYQDPRGDLNIRDGNAYEGIDPNMRAKLFFLILLIATSFPVRVSSEGYGEDSESLGQVVDDYENANNVSVAYQVINNVTLDCMELNYTEGISMYGNHTGALLFSIESDRINANLTDFPVLIKVSDSSGISDDDITGIFDVIEGSFQRIAVVDEALNEYYVDVEQWSLTDELGALWISVNVSSVEDIILYLFFGDPANNTDMVDISGSAVAENVWDDDFVAVYHMGDKDANEIYDSVGFRDGTKTANDRPEEINGLVGYGQEYDPNELIDIGTFGSYQDVTAEVWFQSDDTDATHAMFSLREENDNFDHIMLYVSGDSLRHYYRTDGATVNPGTPFSDEAGYHYFASTRDGTAIQGYLDGILNVDFNGVVGAGSIQDLTLSTIGTYGGYYFDGTIDEVRFSNVERVEEYFNATYFCGIDDLIEYGEYLISGGYEISGYFNTTDYFDYVNGSSLVWLSNTSIPEDTDIKIQFSNDAGVSWVDNEGNAGSNTLTGGHEALDLRDLNYTSLTTRYNLTSDGEDTPRVYQSRLITTEGPNGAGPGPGTTVVESDAPWVALAIILSIIAGLLFMRERK